MVDTVARMYGPAQPDTNNAVLYTAPAAGAVIRHIRVCNTTASVVTFTIAINGTSDAPANCIYWTYPVQAQGIHDADVNIVLGNAHTIQGKQGSTSALTITISGVEQ